MLPISAFKGRPHDHGWIKINGFLIPGKYLVPMPLYYTVQCGCKSSFPGLCRYAKLEFCGCKGNAWSCSYYVACLQWKHLFLSK